MVVRNRFKVQRGVENSTANYEKFIKANQLGTKKCVPVTKNARRTLLNKHPSANEGSC